MTAQDVRRIRKQLGLTQVALAKALGVHSISVSRWERGAVRVQPTTALALAFMASLNAVVPGKVLPLKLSRRKGERKRPPTRTSSRKGEKR